MIGLDWSKNAKQDRGQEERTREASTGRNAKIGKGRVDDDIVLLRLAFIAIAWKNGALATRDGMVARSTRLCYCQQRVYDSQTQAAMLYSMVDKDERSE